MGAVRGLGRGGDGASGRGRPGDDESGQDGGGRGGGEEWSGATSDREHGGDLQGPSHQCLDCSGLSHPRLSGETPSVRPGTSAGRGPQHRNGEQRAGPVVAAQTDVQHAAPSTSRASASPCAGSGDGPASHQSAARKASRAATRAAAAAAGPSSSTGVRREAACSRTPVGDRQVAGCPPRQQADQVAHRRTALAHRVAGRRAADHPGRVVLAASAVTAEASVLGEQPDKRGDGHGEVGIGQCEQKQVGAAVDPASASVDAGSTAAIASSRLPWPPVSRPARGPAGRRRYRSATETVRAGALSPRTRRTRSGGRAAGTRPGTAASHSARSSRRPRGRAACTAAHLLARSIFARPRPGARRPPPAPPGRCNSPGRASTSKVATAPNSALRAARRSALKHRARCQRRRARQSSGRGGCRSPGTWRGVNARKRPRFSPSGSPAT